jgi:hypothetical protein
MQQLESTLGFPDFDNVASLKSIANLFGASKSRCGIYLLKFSDDIYYIGQALDVVRRFSQHRQNHNDIVSFAFQAVQKAALNETEKDFIFKAEALGTRLKNAVHVSSVEGETDLDLIVSPDEQTKFNAEISHAEIDLPQQIFLPASQIDRFSKNFKKYLTHPMEGWATALLAKYITNCIIKARTTEYSFWSLTCMPSTNVNTWPRLFSINAATMELFVAGFEKKTGTAWSFITVSDDILEKYWPSFDDFLNEFPLIEPIERGYRDAGRRQITLSTQGTSTILNLLNDSRVLEAARTLALRVMRKRSNFYAKYHCQQLVNHSFEKV